MTSFAETSQILNGEAVVFLYQIDLTPIGTPSILFFCNYALDPITHSVVSYLGQPYEGVSVDVGGFEWSGVGAAPQPTLRLSNIGNFASGLLLQYGNLIGASVYRIRTFARYLDGHSEGGGSPSDGTYQLEVFRVEQKTAHNKTFAELRLASILDQEGRMLPARRILRDTCGWRYRDYNPLTNEFSYAQATCPYVYEQYFDIKGNAVGTRSQDVPSKRFETCCKVRFTGDGGYPFGGFKGVSQNQ